MEAAGAFLLPAFVLFVAAALIAAFGQNAPRLIVERIAPKWDRVSPRAGWSRLVSPRNATEFAKNLAKLFGAGFIAFLILKAKSARPSPRFIPIPPASPTIFSPPPRAFSPASPPPSSCSPQPIFFGRGCIGGATCA